MQSILATSGSTRLHSVVVIYAALLALQAAEPFFYFCLCFDSWLFIATTETHADEYAAAEEVYYTSMPHIKGRSLFATPTKSHTHTAMSGTHWPVYIYTHVAADVTDITVLCIVCIMPQTCKRS